MPEQANRTGRRSRVPAGPVDDSGRRPAALYAQLKQVIRQRIGSGEWAPHHRVPSENALVAEWGVSRMTVNRALRELAQEGLLVRAQGRGSFVAEPKGHASLVDVRDIAREIRDSGQEHRAEIVLVQDGQATPEVAEVLGLEVGAAVFHSIIVHKGNDVPLQLEDRTVNAVLAPDYARQDFTAVTPFAYLSAVAPLTAAEHVVEAVLPRPWEARLLAISRTEPCLAVRRRTWAAAGQVTAVRLLYPGSRYRLEGRFAEA